MEADEIVSRLRSCLAETAPQAAERRELAAALRAWAAQDSALGAGVLDLSTAIEQSTVRRDLAMAAARAMRLLMQAAAEQARSVPEPKPERAPGRRRDARAQRAQARALRADDARTPAEQRPVECLPGVGPALGLALRARGLRMLGDLAWLVPAGYHDERELVPIANLRPGERQVTEGRVVSARMVPRGRGRRWAEVLLDQPDGGGRLRLVWFRAPGGLLARFREGERFRVAGVVERHAGMASITHPQTERLAGGEVARGRGLMPRYAAVPAVPARTLQKVVAQALALCAPEIADAIPDSIRGEQGLPRVGEALRALHAPPQDLAPDALERWNAGQTPHHERLALEEFFQLELALHQRRVQEHGVLAEPLRAQPAALARARGVLGFELTRAQQRVSEEIAADLDREQPMRRLLQGDVGSGKTAVALLAAAHATSAGAQVAFMAPTEVLAEQHFRALTKLAQAMGLRVALTLGGERASHRRSTRKALEDGRVDLVVGTHALLSEGVRFARLRLVIVDEQHRFGVAQRLRLLDKAHGLAPHLLVMTATPIPRSLALALHGDLGASVLDELPPGRIAPMTRAYASDARDQALRQLQRALESGGQAFVVCPTIEPSEESGLRSALEVYDELTRLLPGISVALLHGQLPAEQKQLAIERFAAGAARVLVSTTIVEVGLDVAAANVILIEHAERFGLAQLHQLRGRVGRSGQRSACLLVHEASGEEARERIRILCESNDGFRIAEEDLKLRGPGELFGRRQSGLPGFRFGDLRRDLPLLARAQQLARSVLDRDPELAAPEHAGTRLALERLAQSDRAIVKEEAG